MTAAVLAGLLAQAATPAGTPSDAPASASTPAPTPPTNPGPDADARLLVGVLDYVAADYAGAVHEGKIVSELEYREQLAFVEEALAIAARVSGLPGPTLPRLREIDRAVRNRAPAVQVATLCRTTRDEIVGKLRLVVAPAVPPPPGRGAALFAQHCVVCHGEDGRARTERAATLTPRPRDFHDQEVMAGLSPYRAFGALTFGVTGTAMAAFSTLSDQDRWSLAFHVFSFLHAPNAAKGRQVLRREGVPVPPLGELTLRADGELAAQLRAAGLDGEAAAAAVSYLRVDGFHDSPDPLGASRRQVAEAARAHAAGQVDRALALLLDAYLAYEAVEGRLGAREAQLVRETERAFMDLRQAFRGPGGARTDIRVRDVDQLLGEAQAVLTQGAPRGALAFWASLVIFAREAVEAALLVGLLLGLLTRSGRGDLRRFVHAGWLAALLAGVATFWVASRLLSTRALNQEILEGVVSLVAAGVLFYVSYWTLSQAQSQRWLAYLRDQVEGSGGRATLLFGLAFLAAYREAFETVLFYQALLLERDADHMAILAGAGAGAALALGAVAILRRIGARMPMAWFFNASGALLCLLAVVFAGAGLHDLRKGGWLSPRPLDFPSIELLGFYPDAIGLAVQGAMVALIVAGLVTVARRRGAR